MSYSSIVNLHMILNDISKTAANNLTDDDSMNGYVRSNHRIIFTGKSVALFQRHFQTDFLTRKRTCSCSRRLSIELDQAILSRGIADVDRVLEPIITESL